MFIGPFRCSPSAESMLRMTMMRAKEVGATLSSETQKLIRESETVVWREHYGDRKLISGPHKDVDDRGMAEDKDERNVGRSGTSGT